MISVHRLAPAFIVACVALARLVAVSTAEAVTNDDFSMAQDLGSAAHSVGFPGAGNLSLGGPTLSARLESYVLFNSNF